MLSTLLNDVLFRYHQRSNFTTQSNIEYILSQQTTKHWRLGDVDFKRYFHYKWENENGLLGALFSISEPFDEPYEWTWDTRSYPWTLNLVKPDNKPTAEVRFGKNLSEIEREVDPSNIVNRLYPLGAGEGVNQLGIKDVNNGVEYIENQTSINEYGLQSYVWVDRRFEDADSLLSSARKFLAEWSIPKVSYEIKAVDLSSLTGLSIDKLTVGKLIRVTDPELGTFNARIVSEKKPDIVGKPYDVSLTLSNVDETVGTTLADVERRQEINEVYAQGSTNILTFGYQDNADSKIPAVIPFYIDDDVVNVNTLELTFRTYPFRSYSRATEGGGSLVKSTSSGGGTVKSTSSGGGTTATSSSGGGTTATSSSGGGVAKSTAAGGSTTRTSSSGGGSTQTTNQYCGSANACETGTGPQIGSGSDHFHRLPGQLLNHTHSVTVPNHTHSITIPSHRHEFDVPNHRHDVEIPDHTHDVEIPNHTHEIELPDHTHEIELPDHTHEVKHEIIELSTIPSSVTIKVDGNLVDFDGTSADRLDLINYVKKDSNGKVTRGRHEIEILPSGLARIEADLILRVFIQSHLGGIY